MKLDAVYLVRFWCKVNKLGPVHPRLGTRCWLWNAGTNGENYGRFRVADKKLGAHRLSYELAKGDIPEDLVIDHLCRNTLCVNPDHLEAVTNDENVKRGISRGSKLTHCRNGHPYSDCNTYRRNGERTCRTCHNANQRRYYARQKEIRSQQISL